MRKKKLLALFLCLLLTLQLSGCGMVGMVLEQVIGQVLNTDVVAYEDMQYSRPDLEELESVAEEICQLARETEDIDTVVEGIYRFYDVYDACYTNFFLADLHYCADLTDIYWEQEYNFCREQISRADAALDQLYRALADSSLREELEGEDYFGSGFFDAYQGESIWDETFLDLMEQEAALENQYYQVTSQANQVEYYSEEYFSVYGTQLAELLVELVALRQQIAAYVGFDSYPEFANQMYHSRDYSVQDAKAYLEQVPQWLAEDYRSLNWSPVWENLYDYCDERDTLRYVREATEKMGGSFQEAFRVLEQGHLYDIGYGENKSSGAFEVYLWSYQQPFIFMSPYLDQSDKLTFAHEFGHFVSDYVCYGSGAGTDVAEVFSQTMEYLSLLYAEDTQALEAYKLADCMCTYVEQSAYALFELQLYQLEGEELTAENVQQLYQQIGTEFGFDSWGWDSRDYVTVEHFFTEPMYIISYVVSNDVAFQIYQLEQEDPGAGLEIFEQCIYDGDGYLIRFAENYGLENPFDPSRLEAVSATLRRELKDYLTK